MSAVGASNVAAGFFGGFPISASSSRAAVAEQSGAKTQLTALIGAALLILALVLVPGLAEYLPSAALAAVVITAALALVDVRSVVELFRIDFVEGAISVVAFIYAVSRPYRAELGWVPGLRGYHDRARHPEAELIPHVLLLRFDAPLFFANGARFDDWVRDEYRSARSAGREITAVVLACEPITHIDSTAIDELVELDDYLSKHSVDLAFAEMKDPIREQLERYRLKVDGKPRFGSSQFAPTVDAMVDRFDDGPA
ncbi:SulP family inorganic anion transporter [Gordonia alkaliphila]|uniref:STAS domain-containing protein n=1 Tax=Gordonia alkaliphila TaxID=1053547 RepID=A0ABP8YTR7_9ACTN